MRRPSLLLLLPAALAAVEVVNGEMTAGERVPTGWDRTWQPEGTTPPVAAARDTAVALSQPAALRFDNPGGIAFANVSQRLAVDGKAITVGASIRGDGKGPGGTFAVQVIGADGAQLAWQPVVATGAGDGWSTAMVSVPLPQGAREAVLVLQTLGAGSVWLDDVEVR